MRVLDLGCGSDKLLALLVRNRQFTRIAGVDVSVRQLEIAADQGAKWLDEHLVAPYTT